MPEHHPLIDPAAILELAGQLASPAAALRFLGDYLGMLQGRLGRILIGLHEEDPDVSMDAILSLKISSAMNGALAAASSCSSLEALVRGGCFELARTEALKLTAIVSLLTDEAATLLGQAQTVLALGGPADGFSESWAA
ncbi:Hpt domain-containing protein [Pseudarthrobacter oxydans]|uniref:Hpt domain-containing protein n=1 Tax=Pseudarthrobacter oxydans TaxID=1671 RepID=UPI0035EEC888|nr:hypothetical protein GCM10017547_31990 [Pseudarthrobacter oxydans]